jgi:mono/diheme cytochrome c family protein
VLGVFRNTIAWAAAALVVAVLTLNAQQPPSQGGGGPGGRGAGGRGLGAFPQRPPADPAALERGKALYAVNCQFCHGADTRGGDSGPSLLRSQLVQDDQNGELMAPIVQNGRPPMPKFDFKTSQVADIAAFLHGFRINSRDPARIRPESIVTGDAAAGQAYFSAKCGSCHSPAGDLKGVAARFPDPRALQQWWLLPGGDGRGGRGGSPAAAPGSPGRNVPPTTATITLSAGQKFEGRLVRIDEFVVSVVDVDGTTRSFRREGDRPRVDVHDPLELHKTLLRTYTDTDIHDVTAYLMKLQ